MKKLGRTCAVHGFKVKQVRFEAAERLRIINFGDETVVFDPLSWDAHLLNPAACAVLELLAESSQSEADVEAFLAVALRAEDRSEAGEHARRLIAELEALGLARRATGNRIAHC